MVIADVQKCVFLHAETVEVIGCIDAAKTRMFLLPGDALKAHLNSVTVRNVLDPYVKWPFNAGNSSSMPLLVDLPV